MSATRVLLVDDHPIFREGLRTALAGAAELELVGEAADGAQALELVTALRPDVVLMDLTMPGMSGLEATRQLRARADAPAVLILTMHEDDESLFAAVRAGAAGYLLKDAGRDHLVRSVLAVAAGEAVFGPGVAQRVLAAMRGPAAPAAPFPVLTDREREILDLVAHGQGNQAIARRLYLSDKTVRNTVSVVLAKLQAADRGEAIARARAAGLGRG
ncbi:response regulator transcription factor [Georgenia yuyongxinii]|uniref:Response regulator transcription factor n=1 Tax=Georgenia yuyongxinii TaxID=2589797 RepID=A0A5B8C2G3_9MICO|nr:response regulator transcription factor [Georgenia yuyongxinii]QDC23395.1 response regulator transcription factor [Georgenia yuyongxinii]